MTNEIISAVTDWWGFGATLASGILTAVATMGAVIYTNNRTQKQLKEQKERFENERREEFKRSKYVVIKPTLLLTSFTGLLDKLIVQNDYNRVLLFSGNDGFEFYDDSQKRGIQYWRMLAIENKTDLDICDIVIDTKTVLRNVDTDAKSTYDTNNCVSLLRGHESIIIRLLDQSQLEKISLMNQSHTSSTLSFECRIEYSTLANQRITYVYDIEVTNDRHVNVKRDNIENVVDLSQNIAVAPSPCRNLQDDISSIDRSTYYWTKTMDTVLQVAAMRNNPQSTEQKQTSTDQTDTDNIPQ